MKLLIILFFTFISLAAKSENSCYTVQLASAVNSQDNYETLTGSNYPEECKIMTIGNSLTVRCGCVESINEVRGLLRSYNSIYENSIISTTYKYRFDADSPKDFEPIEKEKEVLQTQSDTCYTVQLESAQSTKNNLTIFSTNSYPNGCKLMQIGDSLTVRCGCYKEVDSAKESLELIQGQYQLAAIARSYTYRFDEDVKEIALAVNKQDKKLNTKKIYETIKDDEELKLILQVYLYKSDLDNAYKVASIGYKKYPNSYYWNEQMAQISKWTGRRSRSMKHLKKMYQLSYDKKIEEELIAFGTQEYQYEEIESLVANRAKRNPTEENIDTMIMVYKKIGSPEKVIEVLEDTYNNNPENSMLITKALELSLELGELELAQRYVEIIESKKPYKKIDANLLAKYYYVQQDIQTAYISLAKADSDDNATHIDNIKFYQLKTDFGWYLQDSVNAAEASKTLMDLNESRLADYERVAFVYKEIDPELASSAMKRAYEEYQLSYLFYGYANHSIVHKNYDELNKIVLDIEKENSSLTKEAMFWIIKSQIYGHNSQKELELQALYKALELEPTNNQIKISLLWYFMGINDERALKNLLIEMSDSFQLDSSAYFPMASGYFFLSDMNRASYYLHLISDLGDDISDFIEFKFLHAYIYQIQNNEGAFKSLMMEIVQDLKNLEKKLPELKTDDEHLSKLLRASINIDSPKKFEKKLKKAKKYLSKKNYDEINYSWALKNNATEKSLMIYNQMDTPALWVEFSKSLNFQEHQRIEDILDFYLPVISMGDASQATEKDGQIALSQSFTFEGFQKNDFNQNAYIHHRDLSKIRSDYLDVKTSYYHREPLVQKYVKVNNKSYLGQGYYLNSNVEYFDNKSVDKLLLATTPEDTLEIGAGVEKAFDRGKISGHFDYYDSMQTYYGAHIYGQYQLSTDLIANMKIAINENALESIQLLLGGKKDMFSMSVTWNFLISTGLSILYEHSSYSSQDEVDLGDGDYTRFSINHQVRNGYPDIRVGAFLDLGYYDETTGTRGVIDKLQNETFPVLPEDFYNAGVTFSYGMANADDYTRVWRPYLEVYPYYNSFQDDYTVGLNLGYGGKIFHQDHLIFGATYSESTSGIGGKIFELFLDYHFMYARPKKGF